MDISAIVRAGIKNLESGKETAGRLDAHPAARPRAYIKDQRNFARKIREAKLALVGRSTKT